MKNLFRPTTACVFSILLALGSTSHAAEYFSACPQFFADAKPPVVAPRPTNRALCYDAFAILHSGESKTPVFVAEKLNRASVADAIEKRTNRFFADARLRSAERATLEDYKGSGYDRGHMAPAGDMPTAQAMAQSFSLANMVPQAHKHNTGVWAKSVEMGRESMLHGLQVMFTLSPARYSFPASPRARVLAQVRCECQSTYSSSFTTRTRIGHGHIGMRTTTRHELQNRSVTQSW